MKNLVTRITTSFSKTEWIPDPHTETRTLTGVCDALGCSVPRKSEPECKKKEC